MSPWHGFSDAQWAPIWRILEPRFLEPADEEPAIRRAIEVAIQNAAHYGARAREWRLEQAKRERRAEFTGEAIDQAGLAHRKGRPPREEVGFAVGALSEVLRGLGVPLRLTSGRRSSNNTDVVRICVLAIDAASSPLQPPRDITQAVCDWLDRWHEKDTGDRSIMLGMLGDQY